MDDIHICGTCKEQYNDLDAFVEHKRQCSLNVSTTEDSSTHSTGLGNVIQLLTTSVKCSTDII